MITYDYTCDACGNSFEKMVMMDDRDEPTKEPCPICGKKEVRRVYGVPAYQDPAKLGVKKPDGEFRDLLGKIKKDYHGGGNIDRYT